MPRPKKLSRDKILDAAIALVDAEGLEALSMRRLGERLGVEAMSLYRYVGSKAALLDGIHDALLGRMQVEPSEGPWDDAVRRLARAFRALLRDHAAALPVFATRTATGPRALAHVEQGLAVLARAGLPPAEALATFQVIFAFVVGHSMYTFAPLDGGAEPDYGSLPADRFPHLHALSRLPPTDPEAEFERGLELLVQGLRHELTD
ncbi:MAG: TetR/AcrR family transcriptional regulator C-terminal domain-containing protein [Myxococcales bacterium]|nr:TetR/AcrR family transcriptional regulator C-terminal domain-containing protein [Myxococcales bacterium]